MTMSRPLQPSDFVDLSPHLAPRTPPESNSDDAGAAAATATPASWPWLRAAVAYFLVAVSIGLGMGMTHDFRLVALHAHLNLLGWVSAVLFGLVLERVPALAGTRLARIHFVVWQAAVPVMMAGLAGLLLGHPACVPLVAIGSLAVVADVALFAGAVWMHTRTRDTCTGR